MRKKILFLTTEMPYPIDNGGKIRTFNMIKSISDIYDIDLICFSEHHDNEKEKVVLDKLCNKVEIVQKVYTNSKSKLTMIKNILKSSIKFTPFIIEKFNDERYRNIVKNLTKENDYECIIIDHLQMANYINYLPKKKIILSQHNCEYLILQRRYRKEKNILKKLYIWSEYIKTRKYEIKVCSNVNKVIMLSREDKSHIVNSGYKGENIRIIPISVESTYEKKRYNNSIENLLFVGTMSWYPNEQGILWFLDNVWQKVLKYNPNMKLYIVGNKPSEQIRKYDSSNVIVTGYVKSVDEYIEKSDACIVPLFIGGGMRVKILECMAKGIPCISTNIGAEGIECENLTDILIANVPEEFLSSIEFLTKDENYKKIVDNAKHTIREKYSLEMLKNKLVDIIETINY